MSDNEMTGAALRIREQRHLGWILLLALIVRLVYLGEQGATSVLYYQPLLDEQELSSTAKMLLTQHTFGGEPLFKAPLYPLLLAGMMAVSGKYWFWTIRLFQLFAGVLLTGLAWDSARRLCGIRHKRLLAANIAGLSIAVYAPLIRLENCINLDSLAVVFQSGMVYCVLRACGFPCRNRGGWILGAGILAALSWLNRPTITPVMLVLACWLFFVMRSWRVVLGLLIPTAAAMGLVALRNYWVSGEALFLPWQGGYNFYEANRRGAHGRYLQQTEFASSETGNPTHRLAMDGYNRAIGTGEVSAPAARAYYKSLDGYWFYKGVVEIEASPLRWVRLMATKWRDLTTAKEIYSYEDYDVQRELSFVLRLLPVNFGWLFPFTLGSVAVLSFRGTRGRRVQLFVIYALGMAAAISIYYTSGRLRMPLVFPAAVLAAAGVAVAWSDYRGGWRKWALYFMLVAAGAFTSWGDWQGVRSDSHRAVEFARLSNAAYADGRAELALQYVEKAAQANRSYPTLHLLRGQALYALNSGPRARSEFEASLQSLPSDPVAPFNLGALLYYDTRDTTTAKRALRESLSRDPSYARAAALLALMELGDGNISAAGGLLHPFRASIARGAPAQLLTAAAALACAEGESSAALQLVQTIERQYGSAVYRQSITDMERAHQGSCVRAGQTPE